MCILTSKVSKCTKMRLVAGFCPDPLGAFTAFHGHLAGGRDKEVMGREGKERTKGEGKRREGR